MATSEDQFNVAVDFTLYSNPLVKALHTQEGSAKSSNKKIVVEDAVVKRNHGDDMIASDMTAYDSPMAHLDKRTLERAANEVKRLTNDKQLISSDASTTTKTQREPTNSKLSGLDAATKASTKPISKGNKMQAI